MRDEIVSGDASLSLSHTHRLGCVSKASNQKRACLYMAVRAPSKARHHSNYSGEGDKRCQHSISGCKQIMLRGSDDVCMRNKIIGSPIVVVPPWALGQLRLLGREKVGCCS